MRRRPRYPPPSLVCSPPLSFCAISVARPFIPEYIPAVGDIDAFLKVPRPDGAVESSHLQLGLGILDEPAAQQSDPTVLDLQLRQSRKAGNMKEASVRSLEAADKNPKQIEQWITSINELHRSKPQPTVTYSNDMPPVDPLMQAWPAKFEEMLRQIRACKSILHRWRPEVVQRRHTTIPSCLMR
eukprot:SAG31_NODE_22_length_33849_cov_13.713096_18_plen_184_part_00